ncbi:2-octaprenyl-6-methoxyphenol hydroxylase [Methylophaga frappieri]|uniref:2-octaprenyl-6-methoxyphenol hydroxylase n=1 Tax=Methylophaga frappieri (strain ATCC BAA-2434 / DSM 25690 / JAM7) TaxID=754477 RepID=I1YHJ3_METFJ|nr:2-octaprenyl-6-methoxyphenyl hydroxylase [Methylophaga frappieri]AFJ02386.1 2-octaprenyl-6-methoxyphenol hydroxylase [Methylophaga frappieri]
MTTVDFDLLIVGAGLVGSSLALALKDSQLRVGLIEASPIETNAQPNYDDRGIALSYSSVLIFQQLGLWSDLSAFATAIEQIHISDRGHFGVTRLRAVDANVPALGQVLTAKQLGQQLNTALSSQPRIKSFSPHTVKAVMPQTDYVAVTLEDGQVLHSRLLVAADGQNSTISSLLHLTSQQQHYHQTAITTNVTPQRAHQNRAFERFTDTGPLALLPLSENRCSLIWTVKTGEEQALLNLPDQVFLSRLQERFGFRLGYFQRTGQRHHYPLTLKQTSQTEPPRVILIGNAAQSLHPIAGQGFNLGLRDAAVLAEVVKKHTADCGHQRCLQDYRDWQQPERNRIVNYTDGLVRLFSNDQTLLGHGRAAGLAMLDCLPPLKNQLAQHFMGFCGRQSRLVRGQP